MTATVPTTTPLRAVLVEHSHLDREWYRTAETFRGRLVDALDGVLDGLEGSNRVFTLDGQVVVLEDYLELRPTRRDQVLDVIARGQLVIGPWYVQADGLIPSDELIVRNLLEGALAAEPFGPTAPIGYLPDTFGHPAQLPMILRGAGIDVFCFSRGTPTEGVGDQFRWEARDGSDVLALRLRGGYSNAAHLPADDRAAGARLVEVARGAAEHASGATVVLMAGHDHVLPRSLEEAMRHATSDGVDIGPGSIGDAADDYRGLDLGVHEGEIRITGKRPILQHVLSTRIRLKLMNARCEALLVRLAEPLAAALRVLGGPDEAPALRLARRELLHNHAHDSLCGTSIDPVHREMAVRFSRVEDRLLDAAERSLGALVGDGAQRPGSLEDGSVRVAVFNPHPTAWTGPVEYWFDADPPYVVDADGRPGLPPLLVAADEAQGFTIDGAPARSVERPNERRFSWKHDRPDRGVSWIARDLPPLSWTEVRLGFDGPRQEPAVDDGRTIATDDITVEVHDDGRLSLIAAGRRYEDLFGVEDVGDAGDSYDAAAIGEPVTSTTLESVTRFRHADGRQRLLIVRTLTVPVAFAPGTFTQRSDETVDLRLELEVDLWPGADRIPVLVRLDNQARDHRLRLRFPISDWPARIEHGGPYDQVTLTADGEGADPVPVHRYVTERDSGLGFVAPGLHEWAVGPRGLDVTLVRGTGWLSHDQVPGRGVLGPTIRTPEGQELGLVEAAVSLVVHATSGQLEDVAARAHAAPLVRAVEGRPTWTAGESLATIDGAPEVALTAIKPAERDAGVVVRLWNRGPDRATTSIGLARPIDQAHRADLLEQLGDPLPVTDGRVAVEVPGYAVVSVHLTTVERSS